MEKFDLTTKTGVSKALDYVSTFSPEEYLIKNVFKLAEKILNYEKEYNESEKEAIKDLIRAGKENGVEEMEIKTKSRYGTSVNIPSQEGVKIDVMLGKDNNQIIKVKYK